jgi:hypothetical protein
MEQPPGVRPQAKVRQGRSGRAANHGKAPNHRPASRRGFQPLTVGAPAFEWAKALLIIQASQQPKSRT